MWLLTLLRTTLTMTIHTHTYAITVRIHSIPGSRNGDEITNFSPRIADAIHICYVQRLSGFFVSYQLKLHALRLTVFAS